MVFGDIPTVIDGRPHLQEFKLTCARSLEIVSDQTIESFVTNFSCLKFQWPRPVQVLYAVLRKGHRSDQSRQASQSIVVRILLLWVSIAKDISGSVHHEQATVRISDWLLTYVCNLANKQS